MGSIQSIQRESVWDDTHAHLLFIKWTLGIVCYYSPNGYPVAVSAVNVPATLRSAPTVFSTIIGAASAITGFFGVLGAAVVRVLRGRDTRPFVPDLRADTRAFASDPDGTAGFGPILTDKAIRNLLLLPRKKLRIWGYEAKTGAEVDLLVSPKDGRVCDPILGPHPIACDILDGQDQGFSVFFQVQTATLPCDDASERLILSHVWQQTHAPDDNQYLTIITEGELTLDGSMVHTFGVTADQFRSQFFPPIPIGFERKIDYVTPASNGLTYKYRVRDTNVSIVFDPGDSGATHMEIIEKVAYSQPWKVLGSAGVT